MKKFELDVWYVENITLWLDVKILFMTITKIFKISDINSSSSKVGAEGFNGTN
jgi:undecaprenyl phosphate N,N'-diacetylbacillosamine 1-phosphate transferase